MSKNRALPNRYSELTKAIQKHEQLLKDKNFSLTPENGGGSVIFTSGQNREDRETLQEHADQLATDRDRGFFGAEIIRQATKIEIFSAISDRDITSMAFLGDGNMGTMNLVTGKDSFERLTWYDLSKVTTHLKQGTTQERTCSMILRPDREIRVPLTSFIVSDQRNIFGTVNISFGNHAGYDIFNHHVHSLFDNPANSEEELRSPGDFVLID
jgi:hypothetical protein